MNNPTPDHVIDPTVQNAAYQRGWNDAMRGDKPATDPRAPIAYGLGYFDAARRPTRSN